MATPANPGTKNKISFPRIQSTLQYFAIKTANLMDKPSCIVVERPHATILGFDWSVSLPNQSEPSNFYSADCPCVLSTVVPWTDDILFDKDL